MLAATYYIIENPKNLISGGIIILAMFFVAVGQYASIRHKKK